MKLFVYLYKKYKLDILPKLSNVRGSHRLLVFLRRLAELGVPRIGETPKNIFCEDWDNLIILDACRHDLYEEISGDTEKRISLGSCTPEFIAKTFSSGDYSDIIYITGNPHFNEKSFRDLTGRPLKEVFFEVYHTYNTDWDWESGTILPKDIIDDAILAEKLFPEKRKIIHFMQPHYPFLDTNLEKGGIRPDLDAEQEGEDVWKKTERGEYSKEEVWQAYKRNLEFVLSELPDLYNSVNGRTVITSDHGNFVGENSLYGHPPGSNCEPLRYVPWSVVKDK